MADITQKAYDTIVTVMSTELNSLANAGRAVSSAQGGDTSHAALFGDWELVVTFGIAPTLDAAIDLYLVPAVDGTNYVDGSASVRPAPNLYVGSFYVRNVTSAQRMAIRDVPMPPGLYKAVIANNSGQSFPASGSTLKVRTHSRRVV